MDDARFPEDDMRRYCDKSKCPNNGDCPDDSRCIGSLKRGLPVTPSEVKPK